MPISTYLFEYTHTKTNKRYREQNTEHNNAVKFSCLRRHNSVCYDGEKISRSYGRLTDKKTKTEMLI
jgi:hypothetical protein